MSKDKHAGKCRSCKHYKAEDAKNKAGAFMAHAVARCLWRPAEPMVLPLSLTWSVRDAIKTINSGDMAFGHMEPNTPGCPRWEEIK